MCTVSWLGRTDGYDVFFNRDELVTRGPEFPPEIGGGPNLRWIAPVDSDHLGTWIGVNDWGRAFGLLNRLWEAPRDEPSDFTSRGALVLSLLGLHPERDIESILSPARLRRFRPFLLAAFRPDTDPTTWEWDGAQLLRHAVATAGLVATSSGYDQPGAEAARQELFRSAGNPEEFEAIHRSHLPTRGALSACMHRVDASTVSYTRISVNAGGVRLRHTPGPPCETSEVIERSLPRRRPSR